MCPAADLLLPFAKSVIVTFDSDLHFNETSNPSSGLVLSRNKMRSGVTTSGFANTFACVLVNLDVFELEQKNKCVCVCAGGGESN